MVEDWETFLLDVKYQIRLAMSASFQVWSVCLYGLSGGGVLVLNHNRSGSSSRQDGNSIGQSGSVTNKLRDPRKDDLQQRYGYRPDPTQQAGKLQPILTDQKYLVTNKSAPVEHTH